MILKKLLYCLFFASLISVFADDQNFLHTFKSQKNFSHLQNLLLNQKHDLHQYHVAIHELAKDHPETVRYAVANCLSILGNKSKQYTLPRSVIANAIFAKTKNSEAYVTYQEYNKSPNSYIKFSDLDNASFALLVIHAYEQLLRDFDVQIAGIRYHRDQIIDEIELASNIGQNIISIEKNFLLAAENNFWDFELDGHTDATGNLAVDSFSFTADSELLASVQLSWRGIHESFSNAQFIVNGKEIHNAEALNFETYIVDLDVKAKNNTCHVTAEGGPANADIKIRLADCG